MPHKLYTNNNLVPGKSQSLYGGTNITVQSLDAPTSQPTSQPTSRPSSQPTSEPTSEPTSQPTSRPTTYPSIKPTTFPSIKPCSPTYKDLDSNVPFMLPIKLIFPEE